MEELQEKIVELPEDEYDISRPGVIYPDFQDYRYFSNAAGRETNVKVLLPANYSTEKKYPVLYALHGFFDSEKWMARPEVSFSVILRNLQLDGKAEEMIVVLPYIFCSKKLPSCTGMDLENCFAYDNFINDLTGDLIPFIEGKFSVEKDRKRRAITGFSMGGRESLFIAFTHPELFAYIGAACPAPGLVEIKGSPMHPGQMKECDMRFGPDKPEILLISSSKADDVVTTAPDSYREILRKNSEPFLSHLLESTFHDHTSVKPHLYNFLRLIFRTER